MLGSAALLVVGTRSVVALLRVRGERTHLFRSVIPWMFNDEEKLAFDMRTISSGLDLWRTCWLQGVGKLELEELKRGRGSKPRED